MSDEQKKEDKVELYKKLSVTTGFKNDQIAIIHSSIAKGTTVPELAYFLNVCKAVGLNPFLKEIWCYKDTQGNLLIFAGRDGFLSKAQKDPRYRGMRSSEVCENDEFEPDIPGGKIFHKFATKDRGKIVGAYAIVFVKDSEPTIEYVNMERYDKGRNTWKNFPEDMIKKVAEAHALKKAFGINGLVYEGDFRIENGIAVAGNGEDKSEDEQKEKKESERLVKLMNASKTEKELIKYFEHCTNPELSSVYDENLKRFKK